MSLVCSAESAAAELAARYRTRIAEGAPVWEPSAEDVPAWLAAEVQGCEVEAVFQSIHGAVAVLKNGRSVLRRAPRA